MSVQFCCLAKHPGEVMPIVPTLLRCTPRLPTMPHVVAGAQIILDAQSQAEAGTLLRMGAARVFVGEAALFDAQVVERLVQRWGSARIGISVPVRRQVVSWSFETESNEDFSVVTPSLCEPTWEVLCADGESSGTRATAWVDSMLGMGASSVLLRADIADDADLNLCASMVETLGSKLWVSPLHDASAPIEDWIRYGQATQIALPVHLYQKRHSFLPRKSNADSPTPST